MKHYIFLVMASFLSIMPLANGESVDEQTVIVAGGCFWCVESDFEKHKGVISAESGYINGSTSNPTYREVSTNNTGHFEAVKITYDESQVSLRELIDFYWYTIDPTDPIGQFCDKGASYKTALFYQNDEQKKTFEESLATIEKKKPFKKKIVTEILSAKTFYSAEAYHQDYYKKNKIRYKLYRAGCRRDRTIEKLWGKVVTGKH